MTKEEFLYWLRGIPRSLTLWFAALVAATPVWWPEVHPMIAEWLGSDARATKALTTIMAVTIVWLQKGGKTDAPPLA
jgi:hypothetical protein